MSVCVCVCVCVCVFMDITFHHIEIVFFILPEAFSFFLIVIYYG